MSSLLSETITKPDLLLLIQQCLGIYPNAISRESLIRTLELAVCNLDCRKYYIGLLNEVAAEKKLYTKNPLTDEIVASILEKRFSDIDTDLLKKIAGSYYAISQIALELSDAMEESWSDEPESSETGPSHAASLAWNPVFEELGKYILRDSKFPLLSDSAPSVTSNPADTIAGQPPATASEGSGEVDSSRSNPSPLGYDGLDSEGISKSLKNATIGVDLRTAAAEAFNNQVSESAVISIATHGSPKDDLASIKPKRSPLTQYLGLAASLLLAVSVSWLVWLSSQNAALRKSNLALTDRLNRLDESLKKTSVLSKESLGSVVSESTPLYLSGVVTPSMIRQSLITASISSRSGGLTENDKARLTRGKSVYDVSLAQLQQKPKERIVEEATGALWSADLSRAKELLSSPELRQEDPVVINLKGLLAVYENEYSGEYKPELQKAAEDFFRQAAEKGESTAWINLFVLLNQSSGRSDEAAAALKKYAETASADHAQVVQVFLAQQADTPK